MVLEVQSDSSKAVQDSELCPLRSMVEEMEEEGLVDTTLMGHSMDRSGPADRPATGEV